MGLGELLLLALGVSMDAFAVSICKGLAMKKATIKEGLTCGIWFGGFQALMPLLGYLLGALFAEAIEKVDHWVAFGLLAIIGINLLKEAFEKDCDCENHSDDMSFKTMFVMAVATSIDALSVGFTIAEYGLMEAILAALIIAGITFFICYGGLAIGKKAGTKLAGKAGIFGGIVLILIGIEIFLTGLLG